MKLSTKTAASALAISCCIFGFGAASANAMTLMDFIRGGQGRQQSTQVSVPRAGSERDILPTDQQMVRTKEPLPTVNAPTYYTYRPEAMRLVATNRFADPVVTGAVADASNAPVAVDSSAAQRHFMTEAKVMATNDIAKALEAIATGLLSVAPRSVTRPKLIVRPRRTSRASANTSDWEMARMKCVV